MTIYFVTGQEIRADSGLLSRLVESTEGERDSVTDGGFGE